MKKFKMLALGVAAIIAASVTAGCDDKQKTSSENVNELSFSVSHPIFSKSPVGTQVHSRWQEMMEEYLGTKLNIEWKEVPYNDYLQKQQVYLSSGDFDDIFLITSNTVSNSMQLGRSGMIVNINDYKEITTNYNKFLDSGSERKRVETDAGEIFGFFDAGMGTNTGTQHVHAIRKDVFEKNNIKVPENLEEYYESAKKLKEINPSGYPITVGSPQNLMRLFCSINHTGMGIYYNGTEYVFGPTHDKTRFKDTVEYLKKLYDEDLIDPEFTVQSGDQLMQKMLNNKAYIVPAFMGIRINQYINNQVEGVEWGIMSEPDNLYGEVAWKLASNVNGNTISQSSAIAINSKTEHPDLLVKLLDYQYSDEMIELANWGIEGITFEKNENGEKNYTEEIMSAENPQLKLAEYGVNQSMSVRSGIQFMPQDKDCAIKLLSPVPVYKNGSFEMENFWKYTSEAEGEASISPEDMRPPVQMSPEEADETSTIITSVSTYVSENVLGFITGTKDMSEWDEFINGIKSIGDYEYVVDTYNKNK